MAGTIILIIKLLIIIILMGLSYANAQNKEDDNDEMSIASEASNITMLDDISISSETKKDNAI